VALLDLDLTAKLDPAVDVDAEVIEAVAIPGGETGPKAEVIFVI